MEPIGDNILFGQNVRGGEAWDGKYDRWPRRTDADQTLNIEFAVPGPKYQWGYGGSQHFKPDIAACCYRSTTGVGRALYPVASGQDLLKALNKHR